jgi:hypothetical protein
MYVQVCKDEKKSIKSPKTCVKMLRERDSLGQNGGRAGGVKEFKERVVKVFRL